MKRIILGLAGALALSTHAAGQDPEISDDQLRQMCRPAQGRHSAECLAYIAGVRDSVEMRYLWDRQDAIGGTLRLYCLPRDRSAQAVAGVVWRFLVRERRPPGAAVHLVVHALTERYPCPR